MEDSLYEMESTWRFAGLKITDAIPDESTILKFRHLLEKHKLCKKLFDEIYTYLGEQGLSLKEGTIIDASIIAAPPPLKTKAAGETLRCTKQRKVMNGILVLMTAFA